MKQVGLSYALNVEHYKMCSEMSWNAYETKKCRKNIQIMEGVVIL
jgi:hypothetical protein